ncbi:CASP-like [Chlorella sorokiniana]|uniref:Protein CASP n=1 Tax=Chlorella sorokiniana TaxID=3076 RepID=A0A2P6TNZ6_CHLSO|nr:CASP-like [Chlorella sorokiniana]|eukprot:PRW51060.1 CASP-like [Chlorella sorokiniana]
MEGGDRARSSQLALADLVGAEPEVLPTVVQAYWKEFDLEGLRSQLDEQGLAVATAQEASVRSRKALADRTKEFRRGVAPEVSREVAPLLKAYQEEVDRVTARAKAAESAFLGLYKRLYEAPDPAPALAQGLEAASRAAQLEAEAAKMGQELAEFRQESTELKNQGVTIRRLEERARELEAAVAEKDRQLAEQQKSAEAELQGRLVSEMQEREARLSEELAQAQASLDTMRRLHQASQNQLFSIQSKSEQEAAGLQSELELATEEMERSQQRLAALEQEKVALLSRLQGPQQGAPQAGGAPAEGSEGGEGAAGARGTQPGSSQVAEDSLRQELYAQRELATRLQSEVSALRQQMEAEAATWAGRCEGLRSSLAAKEAHAAALEAELAGRPTQAAVEELRQQLRILQAVSGYTADDDDSLADATTAGTAGTAGRGALEAALVAKSRQLEHKLTTLRLELAEARGEAEAAAGRAAELEAELEQQKQLVARLEEDLLAAEGAASSAAAAAGVNGSSDALAGGGGGAAGGEGDGEQTMVAVLCSQRDRFRARAQEVEGHLAALAQELKKVRGEAEALRADNLALAERLKFVQGYQAGGGARRSASAGGGAALDPADLEAGAVVGKYMAQYEQSINPFADFKAKEREARRKQLPLQDRAMYAVGSLISGNSAARSVIFFYLLVLHAVIFLILARTSHSHVEHLESLEETCMRLHLGGATAAHLAAAAGTAGAAAGQAAVAAGGAAAAAAGAAGAAVQQAGAAALRLLRLR